MRRNINPKEADDIIRALQSGIVPKRGIQHLLVGRNGEVREIINILEYIEQGGSDIRFWVGDFGSGKTFMLRTIESLAIQKNFVVSTLDLTPDRRLFSSDGKARALYREIINNISIKSSHEGRVIEVIIDNWIKQIIEDTSEKINVDKEDLLKVDNSHIIIDKILNITSNFATDGLSYQLGQAVVKYYEGILQKNNNLKRQAIRWISGDMSTKTEAKKELGIHNIITDDNWYDVIKNITELFSNIGYSGFIINFDEAVNLYKLPTAPSRERNYEKILNMFNECKSNKIKGLFINFAATNNTVFDEKRGMSSYRALKSRLGDKDILESKLINTNRTVLLLKPLSIEEIYILLKNLNTIYNKHYKQRDYIQSDHIRLYIEEQINRPGANDFLTPRILIKDYLEILDLIRQNPSVRARDIIYRKFGKEPIPVVNEDIVIL